MLHALQCPTPERQPDWDELAVRWLDLIRLVWNDRRKSQHCSRPLLLMDIRRDLAAAVQVLGPQVEETFAQFPVPPPTDRRIIACVSGVA